MTAIAFAPRTEAPPRVAIRALGVFLVLRGEEAVPLSAWQSKKARDLLKILVARLGRPISRDALMEALWPEEDPRRTANRLSVALSTARAVLDPGRRQPPNRFIDADRSSVRLDLTNVDCDVQRFFGLAREGLARHRAAGPGAVEVLEAASEAYTGEFLEEDPYDDWAVSTREDARSVYLAVVRALAEHADARGDGEVAIDLRLRVLEHDVYDERAHLTIVAALEAAGHHGEARRAYERYRARMVEIGLRPAPFPAGAHAAVARP